MAIFGECLWLHDAVASLPRRGREVEGHRKEKSSHGHPLKAKAELPDLVESFVEGWRNQTCGEITVLLQHLRHPNIHQGTESSTASGSGFARRASPWMQSGRKLPFSVRPILYNWFMTRRSFLTAAFAAVACIMSAVSRPVHAAVTDICSKVRLRRRVVLPPVPKWSKTTDDLDSGDFVRRVLDYERSLLPRNIMFPRADQVWETVRNCEVHYHTWGSCPPVLTGGRARLQQGERVRILPLDDPRPFYVTFRPVRYQALQESTIPDDVRSNAGYSHYVLSLRLARTVCCPYEELGYFPDLFRLVEHAA